MTVSGSSTGPRSGTLSLESDDQRLVFRPEAPWAAGETVVVTISALVRRADAESLDGDGDGAGTGSPADAWTFSFTVAPDAE